METATTLEPPSDRAEQARTSSCSSRHNGLTDKRKREFGFDQACDARILPSFFSYSLANRSSLIVKLPFPLTPQFKSMLQSGVGTRDLDVRWVSSLSWYFLTLFGLQPVYNFILGSNNCEYTQLWSTWGLWQELTVCPSCKPGYTADGYGQPRCGIDGS